jgi:CheY-like chemotaxis protein
LQTPAAGENFERASHSAAHVSYIIYADDHQDMREMVRAILTVSGHDVELVEDGPAALSAIQAREPDLLILDVMMPGLDGFAVCRTVKSNPFSAGIPILMLTAESQIERKVDGYEAGADDYLPKPFDPRELRARVSALLRLVRREADRNPTSGLPGGRTIEDGILTRVRRGATFAVVYLDIDHFKPFADTFGFAAADAVIKGLGTAILDAVAAAGGSVAGAEGGSARSEGEAVDFVGHVGGDDFVVVTTVERAAAVVQETRPRFREVIGRVVGHDAARRGAFAGVDRDGTVRSFPIAHMSAAIVAVRPEYWVSISHLGALAADAKRRAKREGAGTIVVNAM